MTDKQELFVKEYLKDFNSAQAAIRAGYSEKGARQEGSRLLTNVDIKKAVDEAKAEILGNADKDIIENVRFLRQMRNDEDVSESARIKAAELLGKYRAMFTEKHEVSQETTNKITVEIIDEAE